MRSKFALSILFCSILLGGCSTVLAPEVGMIDPASQYDDRMLDSLGSQKYNEQQMIYMRKVQTLEHDLDRLEQKRRALETSMGVSQLEVGAGALQPSDSEAVRMTDFASATHDSQRRVAREAANQAVNQSLIENDRDRKLMAAELNANRRLVEIDQTYTSSIEGARGDSQKERLKSGLEVERAKAEAQRKKAMVELDTTRDVSQLEQDFDSRISEARRNSEAFSNAASQESQSQRIKIALSNADSQRRVKEDIAETQLALTNLKSKHQSAAQLLIDDISRLNQLVIAAQGRLAHIESSYSSKIAIQQSLLESLIGQNRQLAEVELNLINAPVLASSQSVSGAAHVEVQRLEAALQKAKADALILRSSRLAEIDRQLSLDLDVISAHLSGSLASLPSDDSSATARIKKTVGESDIRSELAVRRTEITNEARSQLAELIVKAEIAKAAVVAPVLTSRAVYSGDYGDKPATFAAKADASGRELVARARVLANPPKSVSSPAVLAANSPGVAPLLVASSFEPRAPGPRLSQVDDVVISSGVIAGGNLKPLVISPSVTTFAVIYRYTEKGSAVKFMSYLRAYGVNDFTYRYSSALGQHLLFMGKYTNKDEAVNRVAFLNKTTSTANAQIVENDLQP
jgi:hypothetical protein